MKATMPPLIVIWVLSAPLMVHGEEREVVSDVKITTLSTMLTELRGVGEWGFAALVEADGHTLLFDTGARPNTVLQNAEELGIDLSGVEAVVLSHNHWDHTGGLVSLRSALKATNASAMQHTHVGSGMFLPRLVDPEAIARLPAIPEKLLVKAVDVRDRYQELGGRFSVHKEPYELHPGIWVTGPIPRVHPEKNWTPFMKIEQAGSLVEDTIPEDQALVLNTTKGLVIVVGCGHSGVVNTMEYARSITGGRPVHALIGGFHLLTTADDRVAWSGSKMNEFGVEYLIGAHCTGINAVTILRDAGKLSRKTAVVGTVGSTFALDQGIVPGLLNR